MKRSAFALCTGLFLLGLMPGSALAASGVLDQSNTGTGLGLGAHFMTAQTFTAGITGSLSEVDLYMTGDAAHAISVTIQATTAGLANGTVLATSGSGTPTAVSGGWIAFPFSAPYSETAGTMYAIVFTTSTFNSAWGSGNTYASGQALAYPGSAWVPTSGGMPLDFAFRTYVTVPPANGTPPPTSTGVGLSSNESGRPILLVPVALIALLSGLVALIARERRRISLRSRRRGR
jgi:hypothetical protein